MNRILTHFLSYKGSLTKWSEDGILEREILHLVEYLKIGLFDKIILFSYDVKDEILLSELRGKDSIYDGFELVAPKHRLVSASFVHSFFGPILHRSVIKRSSALKTNQISGSWAAMIAAAVTRIPLLLRFGYILSRRHALNGKPVAACVSRSLEMMGFWLADHVVVTSGPSRDEVLARGVHPEKVSLIPTYVDTSLFERKLSYSKDRRLLYVGRFTEQKNLSKLLDACSVVGCSVDFIGSGHLLSELTEKSLRSGVKARFLGRVSNNELAAALTNYTYFVLPSLHEGLPKVLIEAMSAGLVCIGTDIPGTNDLITDEINGFLAKSPSAGDLADAINRALERGSPEVGRRARQFIEEKFGVFRYIDAERAVFLKIMAR